MRRLHYLSMPAAIVLALLMMWPPGRAATRPVQSFQNQDSQSQAAECPTPQPTPLSTASLPLTAEEIMERVAGNQNRIEELRKEYIYKQHIHIATHKPNNRMMREETVDYEVAPSPEGIEKHLKSLTGRYWKKDKYVEIESRPVPEALRTGADLIRNLRDYEP